ncbi:MAG: EAL domain-containing protein [Coriobacteriia bacterium]|nr:EAL domain-containing protein [Coriobacteriia bacterium]
MVGLTMVVAFAVLFAGAVGVLTSRYVELEESSAKRCAQRAARALADELKRIENMAALLAVNDTTHRFMIERDPVLLADDFGESALVLHGADFVVLIDEGGQAAHHDSFDLDAGARVPAADGLVREIESARMLRTPAGSSGAVKGLMRLPGGIALVSANSIISSEASAVPSGTLVLGRYLDEPEVERISDAAGHDMNVVDPPTEAPQAKGETPDHIRAVWWEYPDTKTMWSNLLVEDVYGEPLVQLQLVLPRNARASMQPAIAMSGGSLALACLLATLAMFLVIDRSVIDPLSRISRQVRAIGSHGDSSRRIDYTVGGELGQLAESVNGMLLSLESAEDELRRSRDDLEVRVEQRTHDLHLSDARHRELLERLADAVFSVDLEGCITLVNERAVGLTGRPRAELVGTPFVDLITAGSARDVERHLGGAPEQGKTWTVEAQLIATGRNPVPVELRAAPFADVDGIVVGTQWIARDVTERQRYEVQLVHLATHDALTGLANRRSFETALELELAEAMRGGQHGAVVWLDLDDFKDVNDTLGHAAGDEVLQRLSAVLSRATRDSNALARVGGDEFAVLLPRVTRDEAEAAAERILSSIVAHTFAVGDHSLRLGASVGVVFFPENGSTVQEVLSNADAAMYHAKEGGRSMVWVSRADGRDEQLHVSRMQWNERITSALENDAFVVYAQPILDLRSGEVARHELLVRMQREDEGLYPPSDFLPVAERLGLITEIDRWMLRRAITILERNDPVMHALEVNFSAKAFGDRDLVGLVARELDRSGIDPSRLGFEITETAAISDISRAQWFIRSLKELGCRFSLDDFGTGFSSFYYLKHLPIDCLKIDGSYVRGLAQSEEDRCLVKGIREMCVGLGVEVLAECVEDKETLEVVTSLGLDYAQGFHVGRPAPAVTQESAEG